MATGWHSPSIPKLRAPDSPIPLTADEASWVVVVGVIGMILFSYPAIYLMDRYGRKKSLLMGVVPILAGWLVTGLANSFWMLCLARICFGTSYALIFAIIPIYLGEIASPKIRGFSITTMVVMGRTGILFTFSVAPYLSISTMAWISMVPPILFFVLFIWMPESPYFLIGRSKIADARKVLVKLRGHEEVDEELTKMEETVRKSRENKGTFRELLSPDNRKALVNVFVIILIVFFSGGSALKDYSQTIFAKIGSNLGPKELSIILAGVSLTSVFIGNQVVDRFGRKPLLLTSVTGCAICNTIVGVFFYFSERQGVDVSAYSWLPILAIMLFWVCSSIGLGLCVHIMLGECFPKHLKPIVGGAAVLMSAISETVVVKSFQFITDGVGGDVSFGLFAVCLYLGIPFIIWRIPETKGKSLEEILELLRPKSRQKINET